MKSVVVQSAGFATLSMGALAVNAISSVLVARSLGPTDRGIFAFVVAAAGVIVIIGIAGQNAAFRSHAPKGEIRLRSYYTSISLSGVVAGVSAMASPLVLPKVMGVPGEDLAGLGIAAGVLAVASLISLGSLDACKAYGQIRWSAGIDIAAP